MNPLSGTDPIPNAQYSPLRAAARGRPLMPPPMVERLRDLAIQTGDLGVVCEMAASADHGTSGGYTAVASLHVMTARLQAIEAAMCDLLNEVERAAPKITSPPQVIGHGAGSPTRVPVTAANTARAQSLERSRAVAADWASGLTVSGSALDALEAAMGPGGPVARITEMLTGNDQRTDDEYVTDDDYQAGVAAGFLLAEALGATHRGAR